MTKTVKLGGLKIGGGNLVKIKAMIKTPSFKISQLIAEAKALEKEGADAIRVAVKEEKDVKLARLIKKRTTVPIVADIHFHYKLALLAIEKGFDGIRLNPLNISKKEEVREVVKLAKRYKVPIRVGVNSGGFKRDYSSEQQFARQMVRSVERYLRILEDENFSDIMVSLKGASVRATIVANEIFAKKFRYPLHLGVTATGPFLEGLVKSSIGIGRLLSEGIGDVIRVSLTAPSVCEVRAAKSILQSLELRRFEPEIISCPTCSRCEVDLSKIVDKLKAEISRQKIDSRLSVAVMGCIVNGPGEAYQADIGAAFGKKDAVIFKKDKILCRTNEKNVVRDLMKEINKR